MIDSFSDLGNGWFYAHEHDDGQAYVADANGSEPDHVFGPKAWGGRRGPGSGRTLVRLRYVELQAYRMACDAHAYDDAPNPGECPVWPASTEVTEAGLRAGLQGLAARYESEAEFLAAMCELACTAGEAAMPHTDRRDRLAVAEQLLGVGAEPMRMH